MPKTKIPKEENARRKWYENTITLYFSPCFVERSSLQHIKYMHQTINIHPTLNNFPCRISSVIVVRLISTATIDGVRMRNKCVLEPIHLFEWSSAITILQPKYGETHVCSSSAVSSTIHVDCFPFIETELTDPTDSQSNQIVATHGWDEREQHKIIIRNGGWERRRKKPLCEFE